MKFNKDKPCPKVVLKRFIQVQIGDLLLHKAGEEWYTCIVQNRYRNYLHHVDMCQILITDSNTINAPIGFDAAFPEYVVRNGFWKIMPINYNKIWVQLNDC